MLYVGMDLSRKRLDFDARLTSGEPFEPGAVPPDADGLAGLVRRLGGTEVIPVIKSMNGARFVHDRLEVAARDVRIAHAVKAQSAGAFGLQDGHDRRPGCGRTRSP
jgi:transposase